MKKHGAENGMAWAADSIQQAAGGRYTVADGATKNAILGLRNDPNAASLMAAEHASDNKDALEGTLGRDATGTDLYMAHFLGLGGAKKFLSGMQSNPYANAAALFPAAANANRNVFYTPSGQARSLTEVYDRFADKLGAGASGAMQSTVDYAAQALNMGDSTVVTGNGVSAEDALAWATGALGKFAPGTAGDANRASLASLMRPTPGQCPAGVYDARAARGLIDVPSRQCPCLGAAARDPAAGRGDGRADPGGAARCVLRYQHRDQPCGADGGAERAEAARFLRLPDRAPLRDVCSASGSTSPRPVSCWSTDTRARARRGM